MKKRRLLPLLVLAFLSVIGCGGGSSKGPKSAEDTAATTEASAKEDMPGASKGTDTAPPAAGEGASPAPASAGPTGGVFKIAEMTITPAKAGAVKTVGLKADGTVTVDGKPAAKIKGDEVNSIQGTSMLTVGIDGSLVGNGVKPGYRFDGDDLAGENGLRVSVGDDGTVTAAKDGKSEVLGKAEGGASAKRAALVATVLYLEVPAAPGADAAKPEKGRKKAGPGKGKKK